MAELVSTFQPGFSLFPRNNNRTGWQPVNLPLVLVVPYVRTVTDFPINNANVCEVAFYIEEAPGKIPVAAPANIGKFVPNFERFRLDITSAQLASVRIDVTGRRFFDADGNEKTFEEAVDGDLMEYGLLRGPIGAFGKSGPGVIDTIPYLQSADYYDLSPFVIETVNLPEGNYNFIYEARYFRRIISPEEEFVCIDDAKKVLARHVEFIKHPGELHQAMVTNSPAMYFEGSSKDNDSTIAFYRPFADALQDIFDEQELLKGVNWIDKIPVQYIPYLTYLLGFDMPYFDPTTDNVRKALLRNGRKLQQLKGSSRAIRELFEIFGFIIDISNLWYSKDGSRFIAPNERLPEEFDDQEIITDEICHAEPLLTAWSEPGFGQIEVPFLFRPNGNITVDGWLVEIGSDADLALQAAVEATAVDVEAFNTDNCALTLQGFQSSTILQSQIPTSGVLGQSTILVDQDRGGIEEAQRGPGQPLNLESIIYDKDKNSATVTFDRFFLFQNTRIYVFATYERIKIILPDDLADLRSNRFDINILLFKNGLPVASSTTFEFLLEFLFKFKAFHSLLRKISFPILTSDVYNVTDFCAGGGHAQCPFKDAGQLQGPPPVIPELPPGTESCDNNNLFCSEDGLQAGSKDSDVELRSTILELLEAEHGTWKDLDGQYDVPEALLPILQSASRLPIRPGDAPPCEFTQYGQDRVECTGEKDFDHTEDDRQKICDLDDNDLDYCYKGRVQQDLTVERALPLDEFFRCKPCTLTGGAGTYYMTPLVANDEFSGGDLGTNAADLTNVSNLRRSSHDMNYVRIMAFDNPQIHYTNRSFLEDIEDAINNRFFATQKPSLEVSKDNMFYPSHRFISMANLRDTFTHPNYYFRPWDYLFCFPCPEDAPLGVTVPELNPRLEAGTNGDQFLVYDMYPLIYYGNGIDADIPVMNNHSVSAISPNNITHSIWSAHSPGLSFMNSDGTQTRYVIDQETFGLRYPVEALGEPIDTICFTEILGPIFDSANRDCSCDAVDNAIVGRSLEDILPEETGITGGTGTDVDPTTGVDFIDGYPADFGLYSVDLTGFDFPRERLEGYGFSVYGGGIYGLDIGMAALGPTIALGIPVNEVDVVELHFKLGSGIKQEEQDFQYRFYEPYRMDCGASLYQCPEAEGTDLVMAGTGIELTGGNVALINNMGVRNFGVGNFGGDDEFEPPVVTSSEINRDPSRLYEEDGCYDWNCDKVVIVPQMILNEQYGAYTCLMDGSIPNMMSFDDEKMVFDTVLTAFEQVFPQEGSYQFMDDYGIIHAGVFETMDDKLDITTQLRDPRVWGEIPTGEVRNFKVFRDGIVTTERQIFQVADFGYTIISEGSEQDIERFQTTFGCGDTEIFEDPFGFHLEANIVDEVEVLALIDVTPGTDITNITDVEVPVARAFGFGRGGFGKLSYGGGPSSP
jgi:hypothetical protein